LGWVALLCWLLAQLFLEHLHTAEVEQLGLHVGDGSGTSAAARTAALSRGFVRDATCPDTAESLLLFDAAHGIHAYQAAARGTAGVLGVDGAEPAAARLARAFSDAPAARSAPRRRGSDPVARAHADAPAASIASNDARASLSSTRAHASLSSKRARADRARMSVAGGHVTMRRLGCGARRERHTWPLARADAGNADADAGNAESSDGDGGGGGGGCGGNGGGGGGGGGGNGGGAPATALVAARRWCSRALSDLQSDTWQPLRPTGGAWRNPCLASSTLTAVSMWAAYVRGAYVPFGVGPTLVLSSSLLYWCAPRKESWRRTVDITTVRVGRARVDLT
jgi:hypothetical protein